LCLTRYFFYHQQQICRCVVVQKNPAVQIFVKNIVNACN
jgi:hypothetical protein